MRQINHNLRRQSDSKLKAEINQRHVTSNNVAELNRSHLSALSNVNSSKMMQFLMEVSYKGQRAKECQLIMCLISRVMRRDVIRIHEWIRDLRVSRKVRDQKVSRKISGVKALQKREVNLLPRRKRPYKQRHHSPNPNQNLNQFCNQKIFLKNTQYREFRLQLVVAASTRRVSRDTHWQRDKKLWERHWIKQRRHLIRSL